MKKIVSMVLVVVMLLSMGCLTAFADSGNTPTIGPWLSESIGKSGRAMIMFYNFEGKEDIILAENMGGDVGMVIRNDAIAGVTYDLKTNTLTMKDVNMPDYEINTVYMGDDFKLNIEGNCSIKAINVSNYGTEYSSSLNIVGTGTLKVNENKEVLNNAVIVNSIGENSTAKLSIAKSVTLHVYIRGYDTDYISEEDKETERVLCVYCTGYDTADKAFTADGKAIEGVKSERIKNYKTDWAKVAFVNDEVSSYDNKVVSKSDPDGIYCAYEHYSYDESGDEESLESYNVRRFILVLGYDKYTEDRSFGFYGEKNYSLEEFEKEFTFVKEDVPKELDVTSEYREKNYKGEYAVKIKKLDNPDGVYIGNPFNYDDNDEPRSYDIKRLKWDDSEGMYAVDTDFEPVYCDTADFEAEGYQIETEKVTRNKQLSCWVNPAPFDGDNYHEDYDLVKKSSDPGALYAVTYTFSSQIDGSDETEEGCYLHKIEYDADNDAYYLGADDELRLTYAEMEEQGYALVTETVEQPVYIKYIPEDYELWRYGKHVYQLEKDGDQNYCCTNWYYDEDENVYYHDVYKMTYNEAKGVYYVESDDDGEIAVETDLTDAELTAKYAYVTEPKNVDLELDGIIECYEEEVYLDDSGKKYTIRELWNGEEKWVTRVYEIDESKSFMNGDETFFFTKERADLSADDLKSTEREVELDSWNYWLEGKEYHHIGTGSEPVQTGAKVSGKITTYLDADEEAKAVLLKGDDHPFAPVTVKGPEGEYSFENVPDGEYVLHVEKANHVSRDYAVSVKGTDVTQDVKLCPKGDVNGDGETDIMDCSLAQRYIRELTTLDRYQIACGDVSGTGDGELDIQDVSRILRHIRELAMLY